MPFDSFLRRLTRRSKSPHSHRSNQPQRGRRLGAGLEELESRHLLSTTTASLVMDINPGASNSNPSNMAALGGNMLFAADDGSHGIELWKSDGTQAGTVLVKDIDTGSTVVSGVSTPNSSNPTDLVSVGGNVFFAASDGADGVQLWKSDGTASGTVMVTSLNTGGGGLNPASLTNVNGTLFFTGNDGADGVQVWKSDGSTAGTVMVSNLQPSSGTAAPANLTAVGSEVFFTANTGAGGNQLYKTDGTSAGTVQVSSVVNGGVGLAPSDLTNVNGTLYFAGYDATHGNELWRSDGTSLGTFMLADIDAGATGSAPADLTAVGSTVFFAANDGANGVQLWKSDGTATGTVMVKDINTSSAGASAYPAQLTNLNGTLYFRANDGVHGAQLWQSDGTSAGTTVVANINSGAVGSTPDNLVTRNGYLFFTANDGTHGFELWQSDGTSAGTVLITDIYPGAPSSSPSNLAIAGQTLFLAANDGTHGNELWAATLPNARPLVQNSSYTYTVDTPLTVAAPGVLSHDSDPDGDAITAVLVSGPTNGTLTLNADGSFTYTPNAGFRGQDSFTYNAFDGTNNSVRPATVTLSSQEYLYVSNLYTTVLGRSPGGASDSEIMYWVNQLAAGTTRTQVATAFVNSSEYDSNLVNGYFQQYLGRSADPTALNFFVSELQAGQSTTTILDQLIASDEFYQNAGSDQGFVWNLYTDLLGRTPNADENTYWKTQLLNGMPRSQIVAVFLASPEFDAVTVANAYTQYLHRAVDPVALSFWTIYLHNGGNLQAMDITLAGSAEFFLT